MTDPQKLRGLARTQKQVASRQQLLALYGSSTIARMSEKGLWTPAVRGAVSLSPAEPDWAQRLVAACLVTDGVASNRAAWPVWGLDGVTAAPLEITITNGHSPRLPDVVVHRTRRFAPEERTVHNGIPVVRIERALVEGGRFLPERIVELGVETALRERLTSEERLVAYLDRARRLPGAAVLACVLGQRPEGGPAGSPAEVDLMRLIRADRILSPTRQHVVVLPSGRKVKLDLAWPPHLFALEWNGRAFHVGTAAETQDFDRVEELEPLGWLVKGLAGSLLRTRPEAIVAMIRRHLEARPPRP
jgi:hypothetical protein